jgi:Holliday junction resolvasome RuvABC endonuclease subunit
VTTTLLAIDPGAISGALAVFYVNSEPSVSDIPVVDGQIDAAQLARLILQMEPDAVVCERVASMPKQGVASTFKFGMAYGIIHGVVLALGAPLHLVTPGTWKRAFRLTGTDKDAARALAIRMYPTVTGLARKKDVGRADALLLGHYFLSGQPKEVLQ